MFRLSSRVRRELRGLLAQTRLPQRGAPHPSSDETEGRVCVKKWNRCAATAIGYHRATSDRAVDQDGLRLINSDG